MTEQVAAILGVIGVLVGVAGVAGALYAGFKGAANAATIERLREENKDYLGRLNYIEPRMAAAEKQNEVLIALNNPQPVLKELLEGQRRILAEIKSAIRVNSSGGGPNDKRPR